MDSRLSDQRSGVIVLVRHELKDKVKAIFFVGRSHVGGFLESPDRLEILLIFFVNLSQKVCEFCVVSILLKGLRGCDGLGKIPRVVERQAQVIASLISMRIESKGSVQVLDRPRVITGVRPQIAQFVEQFRGWGRKGQGSSGCRACRRELFKLQLALDKVEPR